MDYRGNIKKYLARYAEPEAREMRVNHRFEHVLVIPAYAESIEQLTRVWQSIEGNFLVIVVANCPDNGPDDPGEKTQKLAEELGDTSDNLLVINRYSPGRRIPSRQGVGLARKIGCDVALSLIYDGQVRDSWIFTTDADVQLPASYFNLSREVKEQNAAAIFPFRHIAEPELTRACHDYELSMLYYAAGLNWANSDYAFTTIGSTLAFSADHYAEVRGFPKRNTGEDFYLLNKLRKLGAVNCLQRPVIEIAGRRSERVPVGTGRAIARLHLSGKPAELEHPDCYVCLKETLSWMNTQARQQPSSPRFGDDIVDDLLEENGFFENYDRKRKQSPSNAVMHKHLHDWFDGLKTRQFVHRLRDRHFGRVPVTQPGVVPFVPVGTETDQLLEACRKRVFGA